MAIDRKDRAVYRVSEYVKDKLKKAQIILGKGSIYATTTEISNDITDGKYDYLFDDSGYSKKNIKSISVNRKSKAELKDYLDDKGFNETATSALEKVADEIEKIWRNDEL